MLIDRTKRRLHRELVANPAAHAWVLNLYRSGEEHPQTVDDYFPYTEADNPELAQRMRAHAGDEVRHTRLYSAAIESIGQRVIEFESLDVYNIVIRKHTGVDWGIQPSDDADTRSLKIAHFLAHAYYLETRIAQSLEFHAEACAQAQSPALGVVEVVLADEYRHVSYTKEAVESLLPSAQAKALLSLHQAAERRANLDFSQQQLRHVAAHFSRGQASRLWWQLCSWIQDEALRRVG